MSLTATDFFCGMGGSSTGLVEAGFEMTLAANHWQTAIDTHAANHPDTEHLCADLQAVDVRYLPKTDVLWASPICTEVSPSGGRRRKGHQLDLFEDHGHVPTAAFERTRVTFWEVIRAAEVHRYQVVLIENVVEAADWELFAVWLAGMAALGYQAQFVSASSAHIGDDQDNPRAPQWRDRLYGIFTRRGITMATLEPRPLAWCAKCEANVQALQWWKPRRKHGAWRIGKYGAQYLYVCPVGTHGTVEPYVLPAAAAIDWTDLGTRIGDRNRPLGAATMRRVQKGLDLVASGAFSFSMAHGGRASIIDVAGAPMRTWTTGDTEALAMSAAFLSSQYGGHLDDERGIAPMASPTPPMVASSAPSLVTPGVLVAAAGQTWDSAASGQGSYLRVWPAAGTPTPAVTTDAQLALVTPGKFVVSVNHDGTGRHFDPTARPLPTETVKRGEGLVLDAAFVATLRNHATPKAVAAPLATFTGGGFHHCLVIPYRRGSTPYPAASGPLSTMATRDQHGVLHTDVGSIADAHFRMLRPREAATAQRFPRDYIVHGNQGEQQIQAGNAVSVNAAHWIGRHVAAALDGRSPA